MPARKSASSKRRDPPPDSTDSLPLKRNKIFRDEPSSDPLREPHPFHQDAEENGIVLCEFYPSEMSNARARAYNNNELARPIEELNAALADTAATRRGVDVRDAVVHWFKADLRLVDNSALHHAAEKAHDAGVPLIALFVVSPQDWTAHLTSPVRIDFVLRTLEVLRTDLAKLAIPLWVESAPERVAVPQRVLDLMDEWGASHLYTNMEYEVDELRREAKLVRAGAERGIAVEVLHDTCVVPPGQLKSGSEKQYAVYTPWFRSWVRHVHENGDLLDLLEPPQKNPNAAKTTPKFARLFDSPVPAAPAGKSLTKEERERFRSLWPAGEREAKKRLEVFCHEKIGRYSGSRNFPFEAGTSSLSVHFAAGTLSARTAIRAARDSNRTKKLDGGDEGIQVWISEVAWRDFYRHVLVNWPYTCMNKPFKPEYSNITWSYNKEHFDAWTKGRTGFPIVDAAMRQLAHTGWMHNRCRMIVASFLAKDLLLDWRMGERWFMEHLVDGDFASNNGGWGFAASVGVDPQPYFRIFNPLLQSEKFDPEGEYIRKWIPELRSIESPAIHEPFGRGKGKEARAAGYVAPIVDHKGARERALKAYKEGIERGL